MCWIISYIYILIPFLKKINLKFFYSGVVVSFKIQDSPILNESGF